MSKYEMCLEVARSMLMWAKVQKANGNDGWIRSAQTGKDMVNLAIQIKREEEADKTAEYKQVA